MATEAAPQSSTPAQGSSHMENGVIPADDVNLVILQSIQGFTPLGKLVPALS